MQKNVIHHAVVLIRDFCKYFFEYTNKKITSFFKYFEEKKNLLVKFFTMKRGRYNRPFLHLSTMTILAGGTLVAPLLADTYPMFASTSSVAHLPSPSNQEQSIDADNNVFQTQISDKPRDSVVKYIVQNGDTLSTIATKFGLKSTNTIKWANKLTDNNLSVGDQLDIPPVDGIVYKVQSGDTVYSIAKKFNTNAQQIVDFPFNTFANQETFSLIEGQILIVPDGIEPSEQQIIKPQQEYVAQTQTNVTSSGGFYWPAAGIITQEFTWYHSGVDDAVPVGTPLVATKNGVVAEVHVGGYNWGYGTYIVVDHGNGIKSLYAHMSGVNVSVGQQVIGGESVVGWCGLTGRTTGPHVHFEIRLNNTPVNPRNYLP